MPVAPGTKVGRYEVRSLIGAGGMGEVYLATDMQLGRRVALKILPERFTTSTTHLRRFEQEARATSSLNHPNILTIYEIGQLDSIYFIATEFVTGETLRQAIAHNGVNLLKAIDIAIQVSSALAAAHAAGIVHRDIKPENIMVREDEYVKLLDFGLAKLVEDQLHLLSGNELTVPDAQTLSGSIVGTISYMSPEQLRGLPVDARTDIWSIGVVLYEMVAGRLPFPGHSNADVIVTILDRELPPLKDSLPRYPELLDHIIKTTLVKDKEARYQTIAEVLSDLKLLRDELRIDTKSAEALTLDFRAPFPGVAKGTSPISGSVSLRQANASWLRQFFQQGRWKLPGLVLILLVISGVYFGYRYFNSSKRALKGSLPYAEARLTKLVDTTKATDAAISPDGKYVAYSIEEGGKQSLWVKQVFGGNGVPVVPAADVGYEGITFSSDANYIYYITHEKGQNQRELFRIPLLGVTPKKILEDIDTPISFSPDGTQMTFIRGYPIQKQTALMIANSDGSGERKLATRNSPDDFGWIGGPAWSPDGNYIACAVGNYNVSMRLVAIKAQDGSEKEILPNKWPWIGRVAWLKNGSGLLMVAKDELTGLQQVWYLSYPGAELQRITSDLDEYGNHSLSVTSDSGNVVLVRTEYLSNIWISPNADERRSKQFGTGRSDGFQGLSWTPNGNIIYASRASGNLDIWSMDRNGENQKQLTSESGSNYELTVTEDGRFIVFTSTRGGGQDIWRMDITGGNPTQLTKDANAMWPHCSPDGRWVVYKSYKSGKNTLWRVSIDGGEPVQITEKYTGWPAISPDGKSIACTYWDEQVGSKIKLAIVPFDGGPPLKEFNWPPGSSPAIYLPRIISWTPDGRAITYTVNDAGTGNIWSQSIDGGPPRQLTNFQSDWIFWFDWSKDGKQLALARGVTVSDVVMITRSKD
jgi:serine/threonine protein kinase/Tol biopolymer transport system component